MTTKVKGTTSRKNRKSESINASVINLASVNVSAPAGAGVSAGGIAPLASGASGSPAPHKSKQDINSQIDAAVMMEDAKIIELRAKIVRHFAAPEWSGAAAVRSALAGLGLDAEQVEAAVAAAARKSGIDLSPRFCSAARVLAVVRRYYQREFENLCGCSFASIWSYYRAAGSSRAVTFAPLLSNTLIASNSIESDFVCASVLASGASASAVVSAVFSFRHLAAFRNSVAAAVAADNKDLDNQLDNVVRCSLRLGYSWGAIATKLISRFAAVPASDDQDIKRINKNLARLLDKVAHIDNRIIVAYPSISDIDTAGGFFIPRAASLPASGVSAKVRKMWAVRARLLSCVDTLNSMLSLA